MVIVTRPSDGATGRRCDAKADQIYSDSRAPAPAISIIDDDYTTCSRRAGARFFLSPVLRKLTPIWSPLTQASSQRR